MNSAFQLGREMSAAYVVGMLGYTAGMTLSFFGHVAIGLAVLGTTAVVTGALLCGKAAEVSHR